MSASASRKKNAPKAAARRLPVSSPQSPSKVLSDLLPMEGLAAHAAVIAGLPLATLNEFLKSFRRIASKDVLAAIGMSERTAQRAFARDLEPGGQSATTVDSSVSNRILQLNKIRQLATTVLGGQDAAEEWLLQPAMALDQSRPIDLLKSTEGINMATDLLTRMEYGVYS
ncbi:MAG: DUF2384 domain-containing protein [Aquabacterium sp.]|uniref:antitoxin Xre/MbcA/ParS toxin-binding domain-containing protein n=1 Tax=Aquabacterium sp. TaxID=1872578 RepID=UPI00271D2CAD|nr:antitoxin Xre/MbcA/ParS toxin-binding domain-containing protein [Aquabacterium sp.]MDO9006073.1 DUF2384 domain-containing protein [Aquabacterium sp.]